MAARKGSLAITKPRQGYEVDFAYQDGGQTVLVQAVWSLKEERTREREIRALKLADKELNNCRKLIVTFDEEATVEGGQIGYSAPMEISKHGGIKSRRRC